MMNTVEKRNMDALYIPTPAVRQVEDVPRGHGKRNLLLFIGICFLLAGIFSRFFLSKANEDVTEAFRQPSVPAMAEVYALPEQVKAGWPDAVEKAMLSLTRQQLLDGKMMLIDGEHPIPSDVPAPNTYAVTQWGEGAIACRNAHTVLGMETIQALTALFKHGRSEGMYEWNVWGGTLSKDQQISLQVERAGIYANNMSINQAAQLASLEIEAPGCSEHQTPWAVDIRICDGWNQPPRDEALEDSQMGRYLLGISWKYGFIRRYDEKNPPLREDEMYHFRYVGKAHAAMIHALQLNLEDYLLLLHKEKVLCLYQDGVLSVVVVAKPEEEALSIEAPKTGVIDDASIDNTGWAIVAYLM